MRGTHIILALSVLGAGGLTIVRAQQAAPAPPPVVVYKSPTCGCCGAWIEHLRANGFQVEAQNVDNARLSAVSREAGVPADLTSCHTAKVGGYAVEGHVPAADVKRMLKERPAIAGIAVPGMPMGSPGMEQGGQVDSYAVMAFTKDGKKSTFAKH